MGLETQMAAQMFQQRMAMEEAKVELLQAVDTKLNLISAQLSELCNSLTQAIDTCNPESIAVAKKRMGNPPGVPSTDLCSNCVDNSTGTCSRSLTPTPSEPVTECCPYYAEDRFTPEPR